MPPSPLIETLNAIRGRVRVLSVVYGVGIVVAAMVGLLAAVVGIDYLLNLHPVPRVFVVLLSLGGLGYVAWRYVVRPGLGKLTLLDVAGRLEQAFPQFDDRLRSTVDFLDNKNPGSGMMQQRVIEQATGIAGQVDLRKAVVAKPAIMSLTGAFGALAAVLLFATLVLSPATLGIISSRLLHPFNAKAWPKNVEISLLGSAPSRVAVGQKIDLRMKLERGDKQSMKPIVYYQVEGGPVQQEFMTRGADGTYKATLDARLEQNADSANLKIWMEAGDDRKDLAPVAVVPRLAIRQIVAAVTPPAYVPARTPVTVDLAAAPAVMAEGSSVSVEVRFNKPLAPSDPVLEAVGENAQTPAVKWVRGAPDVLVATWQARTPARFRVKATDIDGFTNTALEEYEIIVRPDAAPTVQLENPRRSEDRTPEAFVPLQAMIEDDCGITWAKVIVDRVPVGSAGGDAKPQRWEIPLVEAAQGVAPATWNLVEGSPDRVRSRTNYQWELSQLKDANLKPGDVLEYSVVAKDNFDLDGQSHPPVPSAKLRITIISQEDLANRAADEMRAVKGLLGTIRATHHRTGEETKAVAEDTQDKPALDPADKAALERLTQTESSTASATIQLGKRVEAVQTKLDENRSKSDELKEIASDVKDELDRTSDGPMKAATKNLTDANQNQSNKEERSKALDEAKENQAAGTAGLDLALARMENIGTLDSAIKELQAILKKQEEISKATAEVGKKNLGKKPEEMSPEDRKKLEDLAKQQADLGDATQKAMDKMDKQSDQMKASDPASSAAMKEAAQKGSSQKVPQNQKKASDQTKQNKQSDAQAAQQQVELGLKMMLGSLQEAANRKLRELQAKLLEMQAQIANLVRRQANHNLDNLTLQGPAALQAADPKVIADLTEKAQRPEGQKPIELPQLSSGQELTEQNTRDFVKVAEAVPETADVATRLVKAAGKMERALIALRDQKLPAAYDPDQVDALAALVEAQLAIDEQKKQTDDKLNQQEKDAIRARFVKIRDEQKKLNGEVVRIDSTRDEAGALKREEGIRLGLLPGAQGGLSAKIADMDKDLLAVGSVVYVWANKDIKKSMDDVKDDLGQGKTANATRAEQDRIVEQLEAMIKNLAEKPPEKKFEDPKGGGGGGKGQPGAPKLPSEAELRMLKALQQAVNTSTTKINGEAKKDNETLMRLGNRQGELRNLLDNLIQAASKGQTKLGPEPDNKDALPEEANAEAVDNQELENDLLNGDASPDKTENDVKLVGTRMARSRQRLALNNDPGKTTQLIQERIVGDLDTLIQLAQQQQQQQQQQANKGGKPGEKAPQPGKGEQANNQGKKGGKGDTPQQPGQSTEGAQKEQGGNGTASAASGRDIRETAAEWGSLPDRLRDPVVESKNETMVEQYRKMIEDYYQALSAKGTKR